MIRKRTAGSFGCPESTSDVAFPEPLYVKCRTHNKLASAGNSTAATTRNLQSK
ncbi:MAG: hypothetical protein JO327_11235 [Nitrososphaeraceae archaeon]|nr:hypothetical protein [Nitrososphaeraceae archaeon]MBV9668688.1 hypothetical protein [Nitrososphaeraceae archaeon]